ncbi:MAG TPA: phasin family protein [Dongiaceae bacterium]|nr:phasin family protein [Dongiaceae bacterium]
MKSSIDSLSGSVRQQSSAAERMTGGLADSWTRAARTSMQITSVLGSEALRFATRRLDHNRGLAERLGKCASWQDLLDLQMSWANQFVQDCLEGSREFMGAIREASGTVQAAAEEEAEEAEEKLEPESRSSQRKSAALRARRPRR